uniref:protein phosphatase 1 regulatory subunit 26 n=1 Tax=Gasterosteus aculeatus aculeatus TaxID=481459 RepID=UPI001A9851CD|nr:protein phosphatase 1 regulatory subunit 26 [Gasterosteus aculeatus aculeatus]
MTKNKAGVLFGSVPARLGRRGWTLGLRKPPARPASGSGREGGLIGLQDTDITACATAPLHVPIRRRDRPALTQAEVLFVSESNNVIGFGGSCTPTVQDLTSIRMYLMNVPPVATTQTKWRTCGPPGGYSLPICFNDSDTELSTRGTPISDKVQMIIESLRSTQSSLEMGDEIEEHVPPGHDGHPRVCKVAGASYVGPNSRTKGSTENQVSDHNAPIDHARSDSDSDDSVDRGIEEAILEYLKEKDDHKRKAEPCLAYLQSSKISRKSPSAAEDFKQISDSNGFSIASSQLPKSIEADTSTASVVIPIKKYIKNRVLLDDNALEKLHSSTTNKGLVSSNEQTSHASQTFGLFCKAKCPVTVDEESNDSSSDDGIEEAIQRYQLEKKGQQQHKTETFDPRAFEEESDSTSDDGIEEAIRSYQLEQLTGKSVLKPSVHKQQPFAKSLIRAVARTRTESTRKHKLRKKKTRAEREARSVQPPPPVFVPKSTVPEGSNGKGNRLLLFKGDGFKEHPTLAPPKATTTAELMCAEAILDISKTVMPEAFHHSVGLSSCTPTESSLQSSPPEHCADEESDSTSIDSEDGIELEIRRFLEQKAQMHQQLPNAETLQPRPVRQPERAKAAIQKRPSRLSLAQRRKHKGENCSVSLTSGTENNVRETPPKASLEQRQEFSPLLFSQGSQTHSTARLFKTEQGGDKSSSLDSDEDLDTAIKALLKTKKKSKKKTRDLKRKSRVGPKDEEPQLGNASKKFKAKIPNRDLLKELEKSKIDMKDKVVLSKKSISQHKRLSKSNERDELREREPAVGCRDTPLPHHTPPTLETKQDSSSEDSDDSIEEEIQRFLAEKAKGSTAEKGKDVSRNGTAPVSTALEEKDIKQEGQQAEIPLWGQSPARNRRLPAPPEVVAAAEVAQARVLPSQTRSPSLLETADWVARAEQWRPSSGRGDGQGVAPQVERVRPSPNVAESIKWRQSLGLPGLPATDARTTSRTPFHMTSAKLSETASGAPPCQSGGHKSQTPVTAWSAAKTTRAPFPCSAETNVNTKFRSPPLNRLSSARQHPRTPFASSLAPAHSLQRPAGGERESMVHMSKDKSVFVELESNRTNHVQVRSRERSEGKEGASALCEIKREKEASVEIDIKPVHLARTDEEFIDESGSSSSHEKKQGFPTLSLSSAIDPGITFRPCIALTTEERSRMYSRSYQAERCKQVVPPRRGSAVKSKALQRVTKRLQFIPVNRKNEAGAPHCIITK